MGKIMSHFKQFQSHQDDKLIDVLLQLILINRTLAEIANIQNSFK